MSDPWLKISFNPTAPGFAKVLRPGHKRRTSRPGQWVVFDKADPSYPIVFASSNIDDCHSFIAEHRLLQRRATSS